MKKTLLFLILGLGVPGMGLQTVRAHSEVSASVTISATADFHAPLEGHGMWIEAGPYGRCWRPAHVAVGWRPYSHGYWVWTDCGWYWVSDEPWAWACYHYGWWDRHPVHGWIWIPDIEWAPAWVYWRVGGGYIGWAPCPPRGVVLASASFAFVEVRRFHEPVRPATVIVNNTTIINQTKEIAGIRRETRNIAGVGPRKLVINDGPGVEMVQKATGKAFNAVPIREAAERTAVPASVIRTKDGRKDGGSPPPREPSQPPVKGREEKHSSPEPAEPAPKTPPPGKGKAPDKAEPAPGPPHNPPPGGGKGGPKIPPEGKDKGKGGKEPN